MGNLGWIKLHRAIQGNTLYFSEPFTKIQAWMDLILNANHKENKMFIRGNIIEVKRGQLGWSELTMSSRWQWSRNKVRAFLKMLENEQQIKREQIYRITTLTTISNYGIYQEGTTEGTTEGQQKVQQKVHKQECKEGKECKQKNSSEFESLWDKFPRKERKTEALKAYRASVKTGEASQNIKIALDNYLAYIKSKNIKEQYIQNGRTWFNNWEDWLTRKPQKGGIRVS